MYPQLSPTEALLTMSSIRYYLSERFRLRFEDVGLEDTIDENDEISADAVQTLSDAATNANDQSSHSGNECSVDGGDAATKPLTGGEIRTLDGEIAGDEFAADAINYQVLLGKIDRLLDRLKLDA